MLKSRKPIAQHACEELQDVAIRTVANVRASETQTSVEMTTPTANI